MSPLYQAWDFWAWVQKVYPRRRKNILNYCAFHKHANSKVQKPPSQLRFSPPSIIITIIINEPGNAETHKTDRNPAITNHKPWPFEPVKVKFCFLRGPLRWFTAAKNAIVSWLLNFRIRMFVKSAVRLYSSHAEFFLEDTKIVQVRKAVPVGWSGTNRRQLVQHIVKEIHSTFYSMEHMYWHITHTGVADPDLTLVWERNSYIGRTVYYFLTGFFFYETRVAFYY